MVDEVDVGENAEAITGRPGEFQSEDLIYVLAPFVTEIPHRSCVGQTGAQFICKPIRESQIGGVLVAFKIGIIGREVK